MQFTQLINESTPYTSHSQMCLDHVLVSTKLVNTEALVVDAQISDHLSLAICWKKGKKPQTIATDSTKVMINYQKLAESLKN